VRLRVFALGGGWWEGVVLGGGFLLGEFFGVVGCGVFLCCFCFFLGFLGAWLAGLPPTLLTCPVPFLS